MRRRSSCLTAPSVSIQLPSSTRERSDVHSAHIADLDVGRVRQPRDQARLQRARELGPQVRRQPHQLDRHRRQQVRILARELARDLVHDVVDQLEEVDAALRSLHQLFDLAGRRRRLGCASGSTCTRPDGAPAGRRFDHRGGPLGPAAAAARRSAGGMQPRRLPSLRCGTGRLPGSGSAPAESGVGGAAAAGRAARSRAGCRRRGRRLLRARARRPAPRPAAASNSRCAAPRTQRPPGIGRRGGPASRLSCQTPRRSSLGVSCGSFKFAPV